jgi:3-oxoacyl-[acyl-carrier-protein] synthase III
VIARVRGDAPPVGITGIGTHVPERVVSSADVGAALGVSAEWIVERSGIRERHVAAAEEAASDLAVPAAREALDRAGVAPGDLGLVIVATASPDMPLPATASIVASELGASEAAAYDLSAASTGFVYGLAQAYANVAAGLIERALVIGAEVLSRITDPADRGTAILFADGAGAVVVEHVSAGGFLGFDLGSDGSCASDILVPAGGSRAPSTDATVAEGLHSIQMNGQRIFRFSTRVTAESVEQLLRECEVSIGEIDLYAPHQSNRRIIDHTARRLGIPPEKVVVDIDRYGNTSSASIPLALADAEADGRLREGATVLISAVGAGLTWGSALLRWSAAA